jgi:4-hydroxy-tetrahydrodipicolinate synthase
VIPDLQVALYEAVRRNDRAHARRINDRIEPLARVFYSDPWADMHNRMKEALVLLGRLPAAVVRPPLVKLSRDQIERIRQALAEAKLLDHATKRHDRRGEALGIKVPVSMPILADEVIE